MRRILFYIILIFLVLFLQLGGISFFKFGNVVPNFLIILLIFINIFYGRYYKINIFIGLFIGFILDIFSILPFGFWMIIFTLFSLLSYIFINYLMNKKNFLNIIFIAIVLIISYEFLRFIVLNIFYELNFITISRIHLLDVLKRIVYNFLIFLLFYFPINKLINSNTE